MGYNIDGTREKHKAALRTVADTEWEAIPMNQEEMQQEDRDIVEFSDEDGNKLLLEVMDYFFYNGEEYAVLCDADEEACDCSCEDDACECDDECEHTVYIMKVVSTVSEDGEEMEEFIPPDEALLDQLIEVVQTRFTEDDDVEEEEPET